MTHHKDSRLYNNPENKDQIIKTIKPVALCGLMGEICYIHHGCILTYMFVGQLSVDESLIFTHWKPLEKKTCCAKQGEKFNGGIHCRRVRKKQNKKKRKTETGKLCDTRGEGRKSLVASECAWRWERREDVGGIMAHRKSFKDKFPKNGEKNCHYILFMLWGFHSPQNFSGVSHQNGVAAFS